MNPPDIFISYAREDEAWVRPLAAELERRGWSVFWDRRIPAGQTWRSHIGRALKTARCVVVVWSVAAVESDWVIEEADQGKQRDVLVPVLREAVRPPIGFGQIQAADLSGWRRGSPSEEFTAFLDDLAGVLGPAHSSGSSGIDRPDSIVPVDGATPATRGASSLEPLPLVQVSPFAAEAGAISEVGKSSDSVLSNAPSELAGPTADGTFPPPRGPTVDALSIRPPETVYEAVQPKSDAASFPEPRPKRNSGWLAFVALMAAGLIGLGAYAFNRPPSNSASVSPASEPASIANPPTSTAADSKSTAAGSDRSDVHAVPLLDAKPSTELRILDALLSPFRPSPSTGSESASTPDQYALLTKLQKTLQELGYPATVDGRQGPQLRKAIDAYAADVGFPKGREPDEELLAEAQTELAVRRQQSADSSPPVGLIATAKPEQTIPEAKLAANESDAARKEPVAAAPPPSAKETPAELPLAAAHSGTEARVVSPIVAEQLGEACMHIANASAEKRIALVIGNAAYEHVTPLKNPRADAEDMSRALCDIGFDVVQGYDLDRAAMDDKTIDFARRAETADLAFVYYAGHGLQVDGHNYLVPIDAQFEDRQDLRRLVRLDQLTEDTGAAKKAIVVVDASRDNLLDLSATQSSISVGHGLAEPSLNPGSKILVAFSTRPGSMAYDGKLEGRNSPYAEALLRYIKTPDINVQRMLSMVHDDVANETGNAQQPTFYSTLSGDEISLVTGAGK